MTITTLKQLLERDEGRASHAYPDPLTGGAPWTIGIGHTGSEVTKTSVWTDEQIDAAFDRDIAHVNAELDRTLSWWKTLTVTRQWVMQSMVFNMGIGGFLKFVNTIQAIKDGRYSDAKQGMLNSLWAKQVGNRAKRLADMMESGTV